MIVLVCLEAPNPGRAAKAAEGLARKLVQGAQIIAVSAGGPLDNGALAWALERRSFQRIIHLQDSSLVKADFLTVGIVLSELARQVRADVVLAGGSSDSEGQGLVPAALAERLHAPLIARVRDVRLADSGRLEVTVSAGGQLCTLSCPCPVVLTATASHDSSSAPDAPTPASSVETIGLGQLTLDSSQMVPRPELLGTQAAAPSKRPRPIIPDEAARYLLGRRMP